jgi:hypothetical protein
MTTHEGARQVHLSSSVILAVSGFAAVAVFFLALQLPGQNIHGGTLTLLTLLFGIYVPPLCFSAGLIVALVRRRHSGKLGMWLNSGGIMLYVLWVTGGLGKMLELA